MRTMELGFESQQRQSIYVNIINFGWVYIDAGNFALVIREETQKNRRLLYFFMNV